MSESKFVMIVVILSVAAVGFFVLSGDKVNLDTKREIILAGTTEYADEGKNHIAVGQAHEPYRTNPPLSGPHYATPADWGFYQNGLEDEQAIHNLEHGGIWISYQQDLTVDEEAELKKLVKKYPNRLIVSWRAKNDAKFVVASWRRMEKLDSLNVEVMENFLVNNLNNSPEKVAR